MTTDVLARLTYRVNAVAADVLVMQGASSSTAMFFCFYLVILEYSRFSKRVHTFLCAGFLLQLLTAISWRTQSWLCCIRTQNINITSPLSLETPRLTRTGIFHSQTKQKSMIYTAGYLTQKIRVQIWIISKSMWIKPPVSETMWGIIRNE